MTRAELREKAKESWKLAALRASHFGDTEAEQTIEYFGLEIAKSVAEECAKMCDVEKEASKEHISAATGSCLDNSMSWYHLAAMVIESEIRAYAKRLEGDKK